MTAPLGRRLCGVTENRASGGYRLFSLLDASGPEPAAGQFYMLASERRWEERGGRPFLPRALSVADAVRTPGGLRLDFLVEAVGPGTERLCELATGEGVWVNGPLGNAFSEPAELAAEAFGAILVGGGIGIAPLALLCRRFAAREVPTRILLGFRDEAHCGGLGDLFANREVRLASEDGHLGHHGYITDLLAATLDGDDASSDAVYSCGPAAMLEAVRAICAERGVPCELAIEAPMGCGFGACFGCAVPSGDGGYLRLCIDGPVVRGHEIGRIDGLPAGSVAEDTATVLGAGRASAPRRGIPAWLLPGGGADRGDRPEEPLHRRGGGTRSATGPPGLGRSGPAAERLVEFCGIELRHPVINASGTFDAIAARRVYGDALLERFPFAAFVSKTITPEPRAGNEPPRIWETPAGIINSIGLPNKGLEGFLAEDLPPLAELGVPLIVSVMARSRAGFARLIERVGEREEVAAIELNVSCPNVDSGLIVGERPAETAALLEALRPLTSKPLITKLTPNVADPAAVASAAEQGGADAVSLINTLKAAAIDPLSFRPSLVAGHGGLSGPAVRPIALAQVRAVAGAVGIPVIGMGGIASGADALEFLAAGARLVAVGTESFRDPLAGQRVAEELCAELSRRAAPAPILDLDPRSR